MATVVAKPVQGESIAMRKSVMVAMGVRPVTLVAADRSGACIRHQRKVMAVVARDMSRGCIICSQVTDGRDGGEKSGPCVRPKGRVTVVTAADRSWPRISPQN